MQKQEVLVLGATGVLGGAVAHALLHAGHPVRALTPDLADPVAHALRVRGARLTWMDPDDPGALRAAVDGVTTVFAVTSAAGRGAAAETRQGLDLIEHARECGVEHLVYSSEMAAATLTGVAHLDSKHEIEQYLHASGVPHTILCPGFLMETLLTTPWIEHIHRGELPLSLAHGRRLQLIAAQDVAQFVALVVSRPEEFHARRVCIASDEATPIEMSAALARVIGHRIVPAPPADDAALPEPWTRDAFAWLDRIPGCASISLLRSRYPEVDWHTLDGWARRQSW
ncbi:MAG TPA: NmrA/HSCARG family protein [Longimicrobiales bacterium]